MTYLIAAFIAVFNFMFGCHHSNLSRVFTIAGRTYCVCCDCGREFKYSLDTMSIQKPGLGRPKPALCNVIPFQSAHDEVKHSCA